MYFRVDLHTTIATSCPVSGSESAGWEEMLIPGATQVLLKNAGNEILVQEIVVDATAAMLLLESKDKTEKALTISVPEPVVLAVFVMEGAACLKAIGHLQVLDKQYFTIWYTPSPAIPFYITNTQKPGKLLCIAFKMPTTSLILAYYPLLQHFQTSVCKQSGCFIKKLPIVISPAIADIIDQLSHAPYTVATKRFHEGKLLRLLRCSFQAASVDTSRLMAFSSSELESLYAVKNYIDTHLAEHSTIPHLSRKVALNQRKLKTGFKNLFGKGPFTYLQEQRLQVAKEQLGQTNKAIKAIALSIGYHNTTNFSTAFKKMFGFSPYQYRKYARRR